MENPMKIDFYGGQFQSEMDDDWGHLYFGKPPYGLCLSHKSEQITATSHDLT